MTDLKQKKDVFLANNVTGSNRMCCVVNCSNTERRNPELQFYRFPNRDYEVERKKKWINAVRRYVDKNSKKLWQPTQESRICSAHFEGGEKSNDSRNNAYNPTIFPEVYKKSTKQNSQRQVRLENRQAKKLGQIENEIQSTQGTSDICNDICAASDNVGEDFICRVIDVSTQTDPDHSENEDQDNISLMVCNSDGFNNVSIQTSIHVNSYRPQRKCSHQCRDEIRPINLPKLLKDTGSSPEYSIKHAFLGYRSIKSDKEMRSLTGVSTEIFNILLSFIVPGKDGQPKYFKTLSSENRLLLFLMKMKQGSSFVGLGSLFEISHTTASEIFYSILRTLVINTKNWIFWPSKEAVRETLPQSFKNYPNCRCIIDCTELHCDTPPTVEQRVLMYSNYKGGFTVKFLIVITPSGYIIFVSRAYGGRSTDGFVVIDSGFLSMIEPGDEIMADKGFPQIKSELLQRNSLLIMPPFATNPQFSKEEARENYAIASERIHVERAIQRIKIFKILTHVSWELIEHMDDIMFMACILANMKERLIKKTTANPP